MLKTTRSAERMLAEGWNRFKSAELFQATRVTSAYQASSWLCTAFRSRYSTWLQTNPFSVLRAMTRTKPVYIAPTVGARTKLNEERSQSKQTTADEMP